MKAFFQLQKEAIGAYLAGHFNEVKKDVRKVGRWGDDTLDRIAVGIVHLHAGRTESEAVGDDPFRTGSLLTVAVAEDPRRRRWSAVTYSSGFHSCSSARDRAGS